MVGKYDRNNAEELFNINLNKYIKVELIDTTIFEGELLGINCNTFIIRNKYGFNEMFRYEDVRYLICNAEDNTDEEIYAKDIDDCSNCPLYKKDCVGGWSNGNGTPIEPPCTSWNEDDLVWEGMYGDCY